MDPNTRNCSLCNHPLNPEDSFCTACGAAVPPAPAPQPEAPVEVAPPAAPQPSVPAPETPAPAPAASMPLPLTEKLPQSPAAPQGYPAQPPQPQPPVPPPPSFAAPTSSSAPQPPVENTQSGAAFGQTMPPPSAVPVPPVQPPQAAQQAPPSGYGAPPPPPAGYGAPPAQAPSTGNLSGYGTAPGGYGAPPYGGGTMTQTAPPPKKRNTALIVILAIVGAVVVIGGIALFMLYGPPATARKQAQVQEEYQQLLTSICDSSTPKAVANQRSKLDTFKSANPDVVDSDLDKLVTACEDYEYGDHSSRETYLSMINSLERLEKSSVTKVADCAADLLSGVNSDYEAFQASQTPEEPTDPEEPVDPEEPLGPPASDPFQDPIPFNRMDDFCTIEDDEYYYFEFQNVSGKTIDYLECWIFCYDEDGNPIDGVAIDRGFENVEWETDYPYIVDGASYTPEEFGYFQFYRCKGAAYAIPFVNYVEFTDGTYWGITDYVTDDIDDVFYQMEMVKAAADEYAKANIPA